MNFDLTALSLVPCSAILHVLMCNSKLSVNKKFFTVHTLTKQNIIEVNQLLT